MHIIDNAIMSWACTTSNSVFQMSIQQNDSVLNLATVKINSADLSLSQDIEFLKIISLTGFTLRRNRIYSADILSTRYAFIVKHDI